MRLWAAYVPAVGGEEGGWGEGSRFRRRSRTAGCAGCVERSRPGGCGGGVMTAGGVRDEKRGLRMRHGFLILASRGGAM